MRRVVQPLQVLALAGSLFATGICAAASSSIYAIDVAQSLVRVIDTTTNTVTSTVLLSGGLTTDVVMNRAGTRAYVSMDNGTVSVIDTGTKSVIKTVLLSGARPMGLAVNSASTRIYAASHSIVYVIDAGSYAILATIPVGSPSTEALRVAVNPAGTLLYVTHYGDGIVSVIDTASNSVIKTIPVSTGALGVAVNPSGSRVYVANYGVSYPVGIPGTVSVIDTASNSVIANVAVGNNPYAVAVNPAGMRVYVTNRYADSVSVIDANTNTVVATVPVTDGLPEGVAVNPNGTTVYVGTVGVGTISLIDASSNTVTGRIPGVYGDASIAMGPQRNLGGSSTRASLTSVICANLTTLQSVTIKGPYLPVLASWDCEKAGLIVKPGDAVTMVVKGNVF